MSDTTQETDTVPEHGVPPGTAHEEPAGYPNSDRHRTEHGVLNDEERTPPEGG